MKLQHCILLFMIGLAALTACKGNNDVVPTAVNTKLVVINATDTIFNIYLNGTRQNSTRGLNSGSNTGYLTVPAGSQTYAFKYNFNKDDLASFNTDTLFTLPLTLPYIASTSNSGITTSYAYSLFITGVTRNNAFVTKDTLATNASSLPEMRFINASAALSGLQVKLDDTVQFTSKALKSVSTFKTLTSSGDKIVKIINTATGGTIYTATVSLTSSGIYTLYALGTLNGTGSSAFRVGLLTNQ